MPLPSPSIITATQTAVFRVRTPSAWKRTAIRNAMKRTHLATEAALQAVLKDFERVHIISKRNEQTAATRHSRAGQKGETCRLMGRCRTSR